MKTFSKQKARLELGNDGHNVDHKNRFAVSNILEPSVKVVRFVKYLDGHLTESILRDER
jgi:hypothetical protein